MKQLFELATAVTDTATTQISETQGSNWMSDVLKFGEALRRFDQAVEQDESLVGSGDKTLVIPISTSHLAIDTAKNAGEGDVRDYTELTNLDTVSVTFAATDFLQGAVVISKEIALTSRVDLVAQARYTIAQELAQDLDEAIALALQATSVTNRVYGGSGNTDVNGLATGDILTTDLIADAMEKIESNNFVPAMVFIHPKQLKVFRKDSQFVNASEYGSDAVVLRGEVGDYLGVKVITTTNAPVYGSGATDVNETPTTWGAAGHIAIMVGTDAGGRKVAGVVAWKEKPSIDYEYRKLEGAHFVYYDQAFKASVVQPSAVCLVKVTDA